MASPVVLVFQALQTGWNSSIYVLGSGPCKWSIIQRRTQL